MPEPTTEMTCDSFGGSDPSGLSGVSAAILAGGAGTRLRPVVSDRPKPLAEVQGRPFVTFLLDQLWEAGIRRVVFCCGYRGDQLQSTLGDTHGPMQLVYSQETEPLGTAGALRLAVPLLHSEFVLAMNGDSFLDIDLVDLWSWYRQQGAPIALAVAEVSDAGPFGSVLIADDGAVLGFTEKAEVGGRGWVNAGIYCLHRSVLQGIPPGRAVSLEREMFPSWIKTGMVAFRSNGKLLDIGTPVSYAAAGRTLAAVCAS